MRLVKSVFLAGAAVVGLGLLAPVVARELTHRLTVQLPDGEVETITYSGNVAPKVSFRPIAETDPLAWAAADFGLPSFAAMDRIAAEMDRQMNVMMYQAEMLSRLPQADTLNSAVLHGLPAGTTSYSVVQTSTGNGVCTRVTRITQEAQDAKPQVVSETSGCGQDRHLSGPANPDMKQINYRGMAGPAPGARL